MKTEVIKTLEKLLKRGVIKSETTILFPKTNGICGQCEASSTQNYAFLDGPDSAKKLKELFANA